MELISIIVISLVIVILISIMIYRKRDWLTSLIICPSEILLFETIAERSEVGYQALITYIRRPATFMLLLIYIVIGVLAFRELKEPTVLWFKALPGNEEVRKYLCFVLLMIPIFFPGPLLLYQSRRWMRKYLRTYLNENGKPTCMSCGCDLRGQVSASCPECGTGLKQNQITSED